jgi:proteasome lid subunit RPN8/RPN11
VILGAQILDDLKAHARASYPDECCGAVIEAPGGTQRVLRMRNVQDEMHARDPHHYPRTARTAYVPHSADLKAVYDLVDRGGHRLAAFYHSHPDHDAYFSAEDVAQATPFGEPSYPDALQIVVSVYGQEVRAVRAFAWSPAASSYVPEPLESD